MARTARIKPEAETWYHVMNRVAGSPGWYPFRHGRARRRLERTIRFYTQGYCCRVAGYVLMDNHYHLVLWMERYRELSAAQLWQRALHFYPESTLQGWREEQWQRFNRRLFDLSELMRNINGVYATWFNGYFGRRGPLWADRFKSLILEGRVAVQDRLLYTELNPVRARLVKRPEDWKWSSAWGRSRGREQGLIPLSELFAEQEPEKAYEGYRGKLLWRGAEAGKEGDGVIPQWVIEQEQARGFRRPGVFRQRLRLMSDGLALGSPEQIERRLAELDFYVRRRWAIPHLKGLFYTLREQRSHARFC